VRGGGRGARKSLSLARLSSGHVRTASQHRVCQPLEGGLVVSRGADDCLLQCAFTYGTAAKKAAADSAVHERSPWALDPK